MTVVETLPGSGRPATAAPTAGPRSAIRSEARSDADRREPSPSGYLQRSHHARDTAGSDWRFRSRRERAVRRARDRSLKRSVAPRRQVAVAVETTIRLPYRAAAAGIKPRHAPSATAACPKQQRATPMPHLCVRVKGGVLRARRLLVSAFEQKKRGPPPQLISLTGRRAGFRYAVRTSSSARC